MDKTRLYHILDIDTADEFQYYENLAALLEEDEFIEENLIKDLVKEVDKERLAESLDSYFEEFLRHIPESENELYIVVDAIKRVFEGMVFEEMDDHEINELSAEIAKFRKWYIHDLNAFNKLNGSECNVRDARYDIVAARLMGEDSDYDFRTALDYELEGFNVRLADIVDLDND